MNRRLNRNVAIGVVGALVVAGGGAAYAATGSNDPQGALLDDAAKRLDVSPEKLRSALEDAFGAQLDQAVEDGKLTQKQADAIKKRTAQGGLPPLGGPPGAHFELRRGGPGPGDAMMLGPVGPGADAAAKYLGLSPAELRAQLRKGESLADVAKAEGKSVDGLEQALVVAAKTDLDKAVADGDLTQQQADAMLKRLTEHVDELVQGKGPAGPGRGGPCGPDGPGGPGGLRFERHRSFGSGGSDERGSSTVPGSFQSAPSAASGSI